IGSPPNAIAANAIGWGFRDWLTIGPGVFVLLYPTAMIVLWLMLRPSLPRALQVVESGSETFVWHRQRVLTLAIFAATAGLWVFGDPIAAALSITTGKDAA